MLNQWLSQALAEKKLSQAALARKLTERLGRSIDRAAVNKMVAGKREIAGDEMLAIADITGASIPASAPATVPVVGRVGAGAEAHFYAESQGPFDYVRAPASATAETVAVEISGNSMGPEFNGWLAFYDDLRSPVTDDLIGQLCVVGLADGRVLIKELRQGRARGQFHLLSRSGEPILDVEVNWAALVKGLERK